ncbi:MULTISPECIES: inositol-3-phosphate synthase [Bacillus cereus group]|uniref:inositol-3-phosphate synthase n=1 Tax=Bacillus cereus group TaxID=86661 RepID=UPI0001A1C6A6|nr:MULTISPECIES: myo-inositol-1-phosphate synthase [Bacillus cereus group]EEM69055.1 hypothetical protein bthur0009_48260 [Bacillus thuringiensis serovar andalousiensis BGSC 4AW1]MEB9627246.1 myo-inositol-1-phosphate synthase [Bacillus anthracis]OUA98268.1 myo-inositol-1-phosphate synthase [Bacillus thuringiensis serovar oswaldocruzi]PEC08078.1 myo-inositol-1-phosphate synthase [Bacillus toyonensis]
MKNNLRVAIAGVGSCASSIVQLVAMAKNNNENKLSGVAYSQIGEYQAKDIEFVCAFEVDERKVGLDLSEAIFTEPNMSIKHVEVPNLDVIVEPGPLLDGLEGNLATVIKPHEKSYYSSVDYVVSKLEEAKADVLVCFMPTGSSDAVRAYASAAVKAKAAFINATPELISNDPFFKKAFEEAGVPLLGDDLRSHLGATTLHTALIELMHSRGIDVTNTYQLNFGGNMDFLNLSNPNRSASKQISKRKALSSAGIDASTVAAGPNGFVEYLGDRKVCYLRLEGNSILNSPISMEIRLEVEDSPNSAGVIINAIRCAKLAKDIGLSGVVEDVCPMLFKSPPKGATESEALSLFEGFINNKQAALLK